MCIVANAFAQKNPRLATAIIPDALKCCAIPNVMNAVANINGNIKDELVWVNIFDDIIPKNTPIAMLSMNDAVVVIKKLKMFEKNISASGGAKIVAIFGARSVIGVVQ